jgi:negative regulator of sigma E activity
MFARLAIDRARRAPRAAAAATALLLAFAGCAPQSEQDPLAQLLDAVQTAPFTVAYSGTRRVERHWTVLGSPQTLVVLEAVYADGAGRFSIDPLSVEQSTSALDPQVLLLIEKSREGFHYLYRDFLVRDLALFAQNYQLTDLGKIVTVAGRMCAEFGVQRDGPGGPKYSVATDLETGLALRCSEFDENGALVARTEFLSVDYAPDLAGVEFHVAGNGELPIDPNGDVAQALGFALLVPQALPAGFAFEKLSKLTDGTGADWACYAFGDGVETLFFLHRAPLSGSGQSIGGGSGGAGSQGAPSKIGASQGSVGGAGGFGTAQNDLVPDRVGILRIGPWCVVQGHWSQHPVIALGKVESGELVALIESATP